VTGRRFLQARWETVLRWAEARLPALTRLRQPEALPIKLDRKRIYVLPTAFGLALGALLFLLVLGALNYDNNPAIILGFLLASAAHTSLLMGYLGLRGLRLAAVYAEPVHAGETLHLKFRLSSDEPRTRRGIEVRRGAQRVFASMDRETDHVVSLPVATERRGLLPVGRVRVSCRRPLGLFVAWSWINPDCRILVYPRPEGNAPPLPRAGDSGLPRRQRAPDEEVHGLRDYRMGDAVRTIAWKRSAQIGRLLVREFEAPQGQEAILDWASLAPMEAEARIRRLARWVIEAERLGLRSELRLPDGSIGPERGHGHMHRCLSRLATLPAVPGSPSVG